jgi:hypothetical protein
MYCLFHGNFLAASREYQHLRQFRRRVYGTVQRNLRETGTLMPEVLVDRGRDNVRAEEDVLDNVNDNRSASTHHTSSATGLS